ncbi:MAG TPA: molybdopterin-dependent oxidoreductase [Myxococcota bacterium]|nr:molybdopterin-dependent oxidoreductase [Myxococcota bacterium]
MSERELRTFCRVCEPACGLVATVRDGELVQLRPDRDHPVTRGFACNKGLAGVDIHRDPDRLDFPVRRGERGAAERVSWDAAIDGIAASLRAILAESGPEALAMYVGNPTAFNTLARPAMSAFSAQLGGMRSFSSGTQDCANKFAGSEAVFGSSTIHPIPDLDHTDFLLVFGANPRVSHGSFISIADPMKKLRELRRRGARLRFVNPRAIESAEPGELVQIRPDTDVYLMAALLHELARSGGLDRELLRERGKHVDELLAFAARYPAERAAAVTGVSAETVRQLARALAAARGASLHMSTGVNMGRQGTLAYWLLHMLSFATGNLDQRGGNILSVGFYAAAKAGRREFAKSFADTEFGRLRRGGLPGNLLADAILGGRKPIRALIVVAGNPLLSIGGEARMRAALAKLELLVCIDLYKNATGEYAHWLLPSADMFERADVNITGLGLQHEPWIQFTDAVVEPRAERREEWWIFARLAQALGLRSPLDAGPDPELWGRVDHMLRSRGHSLDEVRAAEPALVFEPLAPGRFYAEQLQTVDGRIECCPPEFAPALARAESIFAELEAEGLAQLKLITRRDLHMHNSWYANVPVMKHGKHDRNRLFVHPDDARARGLADGSKARLWNEHGALELEIAFDAGLLRGVVALTHGWGNRGSTGMRVAARTPGVNANALLPAGEGSFEPLSSQAFMTGVPVELAPL